MLLQLAQVLILPPSVHGGVAHIVSRFDLCPEYRLRRGPGEHGGGLPEERVHAELRGRGVARSAEATRHALAALGAISYARALEGGKPERGS